MATNSIDPRNVPTDADIARDPNVRKFRAYVAAQVDAFTRQLAPLAMMAGIGDIETMFDRAPSYVGDAWRACLTAGRAMLTALDRWKDDEHGTS